MLVWTCQEQAQSPFDVVTSLVLCNYIDVITAKILIKSRDILINVGHSWSTVGWLASQLYDNTVSSKVHLSMNHIKMEKGIN